MHTKELSIFCIYYLSPPSCTRGAKTFLWAASRRATDNILWIMIDIKYFRNLSRTNKDTFHAVMKNISSIHLRELLSIFLNTRAGVIPLEQSELEQLQCYKSKFLKYTNKIENLALRHRQLAQEYILVKLLLKICLRYL